VGTLDQYDTERGALTLAAFGREYHLGQTFIYQLIKDGKLRAVKVGRRTLILKRDAEAWVKSLPEMRAAS